MNRIIDPLSRRGRRALLLACVVPLAACDDGFGPQPWNDTPDTTEVYSLARAEHIGLPGAYNFVWSPVPGRIIVEQQRSGSPAVFDIGFTETAAGFMAMPAGLFDGFDIRPGLQAQPQETFESLEEAPREDYITEALVPLQTGTVYAVRTRTAPNGCTFYGKFQVLELDEARGVVRLQATASPVCNNRSLVPPDVD